MKTEVSTSRLFTDTKIPGEFRILSVGDVHLGNPRTSTRWTINNLDKYITNKKVLSQVDALVIPGDLFDRILSNNDPQVYAIQEWATRLLWMCAACDVILRVVEGTPSHDREQSQFLVEQARNAKIPVDLHYASTTSIEYNERFGIHILYVPDKAHTDTAETLQVVRELMHKHGITQVDFAIMHGAFEYQLPAMVTEPSHDSAAYLALVRYYIFIGHVHTMTQRDRILAAGSIERDRHGSPEAKGYFDVTVTANGQDKIVFVENKDAKRYLTVDCIDTDIKSANEAIRAAIAANPPGSAIQVRCRPHDPVAGDFDTIRKTYPTYELTLDKRKSDAAKQERDLAHLLDIDTRQFTPITASTLADQLEAHILSATTDPALQERCRLRLRSVIKETT